MVAVAGKGPGPAGSMGSNGSRSLNLFHKCSRWRCPTVRAADRLSQGSMNGRLPEQSVWIASIGGSGLQCEQANMV